MARPASSQQQQQQQQQQVRTPSHPAGAAAGTALEAWAMARQREELSARAKDVLARQTARDPTVPAAARPIKAGFHVHTQPPHLRHQREAEQAGRRPWLAAASDPVHRVAAPERQISTPPRSQQQPPALDPFDAANPAPPAPSRNPLAQHYRSGRGDVDLSDDDSAFPAPPDVAARPRPKIRRGVVTTADTSDSDDDGRSISSNGSDGDAFPEPPAVAPAPLFLEDPLLAHVRRQTGGRPVAGPHDPSDAGDSHAQTSAHDADDGHGSPITYSPRRPGATATTTGGGAEPLIALSASPGPSPPRRAVASYHVLPIAPSPLSPEYALRERMALGCFPDKAPLAARHEPVGPAATDPLPSRSRQPTRGGAHAATASQLAHARYESRFGDHTAEAARSAGVGARPSKATVQHQPPPRNPLALSLPHRATAAASTSFGYADAAASRVQVLGAATSARYRTALHPTYDRTSVL
jgi:hypothetical protein